MLLHPVNEGNNNNYFSNDTTQNSSVIRQKGESQNGCFKKTNHAEISEKQTFLTL